MFQAIGPAGHTSTSSPTKHPGDRALPAKREKLLGEVPVEPDGSFFMEVPARTPLRLQTVGADGQVLQAMRSWIWVMPVEARGCIGCHEDRELTPPNRFVSALRRPPHPVGLVGDNRRSPTMWPRSGAKP